MSASKSKLKMAEKPKPHAIEQTVESVIASKTALSEFDHEHAKKVYAEEEAAKTAFQQAVADLNMATGARQSFAGYLIKAYGMTGLDEIDLETGVITRDPAKTE